MSEAKKFEDVCKELLQLSEEVQMRADSDLNKCPNEIDSTNTGFN